MAEIPDELARALAEALLASTADSENDVDRARRLHRERQRKYDAKKRQGASDSDADPDAISDASDAPEMSESITILGEILTDRPTPFGGREVGQSGSPDLTLSDADADADADADVSDARYVSRPRYSDDVNPRPLPKCDHGWHYDDRGDAGDGCHNDVVAARSRAAYAADAARRLIGPTEYQKTVGRDALAKARRVPADPDVF